METPIPTTLAQPAQRALANEGITKLEQLRKYTKRQIADLHGMGPNAMKKLIVAMEEKGISFSD